MKILHLATAFALSAPAATRADEIFPGDSMTNAQLIAPAAVIAAPDPAQEVVAFWRDAGPSLWFAKDAAFDARFRERFLPLYEAAVRGELAAWSGTSQGALALVILLDQFPRNAFRGTSRMYAADALAREAATAAIAAGQDRTAARELQRFFYLPYAHSEDLRDQERAVALVRRLGEPDLSHALGHHDIIQRFGRFPHRNPILGRVPTASEREFLEDGGYAG